MRGRLSTPRLLVFAAASTVALRFAANTLIETAEELTPLETSHPADRVQFVEERLFEDDGYGQWTTTRYAEETMVRSQFPRTKGTRPRIFALGGSFMMGTPYVMQQGPNRRGSIPHFVSQGLDADVINAAAGGQNSSRVLAIAKQVLHLDPDALLVATCNNEGELRPGGMRVWLNQQGGYRLLKKALLRERPDAHFTPQDPDTSAVREDFRRNLRELIEAADARDVPVFLTTLPVNLLYRGWEVGHEVGESPPGTDLPQLGNPPLLPRPEGFSYQDACTFGVTLFEAGAVRRARPLLRECVNEQNSDHRLRPETMVYAALSDLELGEIDATTKPYLEATLGPCLTDAMTRRHLGDLEGALDVLQGCDDTPNALRERGLIQHSRQQYIAAKDTLEEALELVPRNRCRPSFNAIIRQEAARSEGVTLIDLEAHAKSVSAHGIPGSNLFLDYCHMSWRGYAEVARPIIETMGQALKRTARELETSDLPPGDAAEQIRLSHQWREPPGD